tara:strand:+ start:3841 stop:5538 length:1698 start_codon:yes stop_codon:yes gene_type:complete
MKVHLQIILLCIAVLLTSCSQDSVDPTLQTPELSQVNWKALQDTESSLGYQDVAPFLNHAHYKVAKSILSGFPNLQDQDMVKAHIALIENNFQVAYEEIKPYLNKPVEPKYRLLFFSILTKSGHWDQALKYARVAEAKQMLFFETIEQLKEPSSIMNTEAKGWAQLFIDIKSHYDTPEYYAYQVNKWRKENPHHPANSLLKDIALPAKGQSVIGVMLPLSGQMQQAGISVREGIIAAHMASSLRREWSLVFYDTNQGPIDEIYAKGKSVGVTHWIGPLEKNQAQDFANIVDKNSNALILNSVDHLPKHVRSFSLSPEDESTQVAKKLIKLGYRNALIIEGEHPWSARQSESFETVFSNQGGHVVDHISLGGKRYADAIHRGLKIDTSQYHFHRVQALTSQPIKFIPSPRTDIDVIFIASSPNEALQVRPLLKYNLAGDIPIFATSSVLNDRPIPHRDKDLDGLVFCDSLTNLNDAPRSGIHDRIIKLLNTLQKNNSQQYKDQYRFYSLGIDAYHTQLLRHRLESFPSLGFTGATGQIYMDDNVIKRRLFWGKYQNGQIINYTHNL